MSNEHDWQLSFTRGHGKLRLSQWLNWWTFGGWSWFHVVLMYAVLNEIICNACYFFVKWHTMAICLNIPGFFFNIFAKTQVPKKLNFCPSGKNSSPFLSKNSNWGQLFSILEKTWRKGWISISFQKTIHTQNKSWTHRLG